MPVYKRSNQHLPIRHPRRPPDSYADCSSPPIAQLGGFSVCVLDLSLKNILGRGTMDLEVRLAQVEAQFNQLYATVQRIEADLRDDRATIRKQLSEIYEAVERRQVDFVREREVTPQLETVSKTMKELRNDHDKLNDKVDRLLGWRNFVVGASVLLSFIVGVLSHNSSFIQRIFGF